MLPSSIEVWPQHKDDDDVKVGTFVTSSDQTNDTSKESGDVQKQSTCDIFRLRKIIQHTASADDEDSDVQEIKRTEMMSSDQGL